MTFSFVPPKPDRFVVTGALEPAMREGGYRDTAIAPQAPLVIRWRWFTPATIGILFFAFVWDAFLAIWYGVGIKAGGPWIMFVFPLVHVAAGVAITYGALASLLNSTTITVDADRVRAVMWPLRNPFKPPFDLARSEIRRVSVITKEGEKSTTYRVVATDATGTVRRITSLDSLDEANFVAWAIEFRLGLEG